MGIKEQILELWNDDTKCPDFTPVLNDLLDRLETADKALEQVAMYGRINHDRPKDYRELVQPYINKYIPNSREAKKG